MRVLLLLHGPNLNRLGSRDPQHYGTVTLTELEAQFREWARAHRFDVKSHQSNHEGALIDHLQEASSWASGAVVNPGALSHTSYSLHDALIDFSRPAVEVHLSRVSEREEWRRTSVIRPACIGSFEGLGPEGYLRAIELLDAVIGR
jgi:3-dehydroquinate dehydratase-2